MHLIPNEFKSKTIRKKRHASISFRIMSAIISYSKGWTERMNSFSRLFQSQLSGDLYQHWATSRWRLVQLIAARDSLLLQPTSAKLLIVRYAFSSSFIFANKVEKVWLLMVFINLLLSWRHCICRILPQLISKRWKKSHSSSTCQAKFKCQEVILC